MTRRSSTRGNDEVACVGRGVSGVRERRGNGTSDSGSLIAQWSDGGGGSEREEEEGTEWRTAG